MSEDKRIGESLTRYGIERVHFETFYQRLENGEVPSKGIVPDEQYDLLVRYFTNEQVLDPDSTINQESLKLFRTKLELEKILNQTAREPHKRPRPHGGFAPIKHHGGNGGFFSCTDDDESF